MSSRVTDVARETVRDEPETGVAFRVVERDIWVAVRVAIFPAVVRETTLPVVLRGVAFRSVVTGLRVVVVRPRTFCTVLDVAELRRLALSVLF